MHLPCRITSYNVCYTKLLRMWELAAEESRVSGKIYMKNDDSFRVEMPEGDYVLSNGKTVWRYSVENKQVLVEVV